MNNLVVITHIEHNYKNKIFSNFNFVGKFVKTSLPIRALNITAIYFMFGLFLIKDKGFF
jgi:hypothetical protein